LPSDRGALKNLSQCAGEGSVALQFNAIPAHDARKLPQTRPAHIANMLSDELGSQCERTQFDPSTDLWYFSQCFGVPGTGVSLQWQRFHHDSGLVFFENQGAGVALADLTGAGARDLIVLMVDNPPDQNRGLYRVGKKLAADGTATGGWTPWMEIPDWFPFENQGVDVAVADLTVTDAPS